MEEPVIYKVERPKAVFPPLEGGAGGEGLLHQLHGIAVAELPAVKEEVEAPISAASSGIGPLKSSLTKENVKSAKNLGKSI